MDKVAASADGFGKTLVAAGAAAAAAGAAVAAGLAVGVKAAGDLQQAVASISTIKPDIDTSAVFSALNELSTRVPQTASELGESLYDVFSSIGEITQEQALKLTETFAKGAVGAQTDAKTFGTAISGVLNAYKLDVSEAAAVSDMFFAIVRDGVVTGPELAASLGPVTQSAKAAGVELKELGPLIAAVTKEGGPAAQNINNLNNFLSKFTTSDAQTAMNKLGVATQDATGAFRSVPDVLRDLKVALEQLTEAERANALQTIFPDAQARQGAATLMSQLDFVDKALAESAANAGLSEAAYKKMSETFNSQSKLLMNTLTSIATTIGAEVLPAITPLITAFSKNLPDAFKTVQQVFAQDWSPDPSQIDPFVNKVGEFAILVRDQVVPAVSSLVDWLRTNLPPALTWLSETGWPALVTAGEAVGRTIGEIAAFFKDLIGELQEQGAFTELGAAWKSLTEIGASVARMFAQDFNPQLKTAGGQAITTKDVIVQLARDITTMVREINAAITAFRNFVQWMEQARQTALDLSRVLSGFTGGNILDGIDAVRRLTNPPAPARAPAELTSPNDRGRTVDRGFILDPSTVRDLTRPPTTSTGANWPSALFPSGGSGFSSGNLPSALFPSFDNGGIVPGPFGRPMLAVVHGGEEFSGVGRRLGGGLTVNGPLIDMSGATITNEADEDRLVNKAVTAFAQLFAVAMKASPAAPSTLIGA